MDQQALAQFEAVQQALQSLDAQLNRIEEQAMDLRRAKSTLEAVAEGAESLIPIGGGLHLRASIPAGNVVTPIGAGYAADLDLETAKAQLDGRIAEADALLQQRQQEAERLAQQAQQLANQLQSQD